MILALFEDSYTTNSDALLVKMRARTRLALSSAFVLTRSTDPDAFQASIDGAVSHIASVGPVGSSVSGSSTDSTGITKAQCIALLQAMGINERHEIINGINIEHHILSINDFVFTHLDQDNSGKIEFIEFEKLLLLCRCCDRLTKDKLLAHKTTIARADLLKADAYRKLLDELSNEQRHLLEEKVACQERTLTNAHSNIDVYLNHLNQSFKIFGWCETRWLNNIAFLVGVVHFWAIALDGTAWVGVCFNFAYCFELTIRIHNMQSLVLFCNDPRGCGHALQNKVSLGSTVVGMFGAMLVVLQKCGVGINYEQLWRAIQLAPLLRIFVTNSAYCQIVRALLSGLERISPFMTLFLILFYTFCMLAHNAFMDLDTVHGEVFSEQLNFSTFGDSCLAMFQAISCIMVQ